MSDTLMPGSAAVASGVIHDIGYRRYEGPRLGRAYVVRSLYSHGLRAAFGFGRGVGAKVFTWIVFGLVMMVAAILTAIRSQTGEMPVPYWQFAGPINLLIVLFCAVVGPELVSRDLRSGVLSLYYSRPLSRSDYALAKWASLVSAVFILATAPLLLMFLGGAFSVDGLSAVWGEFVQFSKGLLVMTVLALVFGSLTILLSSLSGRRAIAAVMVVALFIVTPPIYAIIQGLTHMNSQDGTITGTALQLSQLAGLVSPQTLVAGVGAWLFDPSRPFGDYGPIYGAEAVGITVIAVLLLLLRYRKVAR